MLFRDAGLLGDEPGQGVDADGRERERYFFRRLRVHGRTRQEKQDEEQNHGELESRSHMYLTRRKILHALHLESPFCLTTITPGGRVSITKVFTEGVSTQTNLTKSAFTADMR